LEAEDGYVDDCEEHETLICICPLLKHLDGGDVGCLVVGFCELTPELRLPSRGDEVVVWNNVDIV
jgi:hypothetical protein